MATNACAELFRSVAANFNKSCCNMTCSSAGSPLCCRAGSLQNIQNVGAQCSFYYFKTWKANELFLPSQKLLLELSHFFFSLHLLKEPPPPMESYCLPEAELYFQNNKELGTGLSQKRKAAGEMSRVKRSRIRWENLVFLTCTFCIYIFSFLPWKLKALSATSNLSWD